jgi:hypothetical protein
MGEGLHFVDVLLLYGLACQHELAATQLSFLPPLLQLSRPSLQLTRGHQVYSLSQLVLDLDLDAFLPGVVVDGWRGVLTAESAVMLGGRGEVLWECG